VKKVLLTTVALFATTACYTDQKAPTLATLASFPTPPAPTPVATSSPAPATSSTALPAATTSVEVGDMSDDGNKNIIIANYLAKAITKPFASGWDANKVFAGLADGSVRSYVAGSYLGSPGWSAAPQEDKYYAKDGKSLVGGNLITPIPTDSDIDGGNIAFASKDGGTTWKQVAWNNSTGPKNYSAYYGPEDKFKWAGWKLTKR
jgi:hypothetical protein